MCCCFVRRSIIYNMHLIFGCPDGQFGRCAVLNMWCCTFVLIDFRLRIASLLSLRISEVSQRESQKQIPRLCFDITSHCFAASWWPGHCRLRWWPLFAVRKGSGAGSGLALAVLRACGCAFGRGLLAGSLRVS